LQAIEDYTMALQLDTKDTTVYAVNQRVA